MVAKQALPGRKRKADSSIPPERSPLGAISNSNSSKRTKPVPCQQLGQSFLSFSSKPLHTTCKKCGMQYANLSVEDKTLHKKFCKSINDPIDWPHFEKHATERYRFQAVLLKTGSTRIEGSIATIQYSAAPKAAQVKLSEILAHVEESLSATRMSKEDLQASTFYLCLRHASKSLTSIRREVVGCAVVRPVTSAYRVVVEPPNHRDQKDETTAPEYLRFGEDDTALFCSPTTVPASVGVDRIWTAPTLRGCGIAAALLDAIADQAIYGAPIHVDKRRDLVAFSQPTQAGARLFSRWVGTKAFLIFT